MADNWLIKQTVDLARPETAIFDWRATVMMQGDINAHTWQVAVNRNGIPVDLTGSMVTCRIVRPISEDTVFIEGGIEVGPVVIGVASNNVLTATLPSEAYAYDGNIMGIMRYTKPDASQSVTAAILYATVRGGVPKAIIDPGEAIPSIEEMLALIYEMERLIDAYEGIDVSATTLPAYTPATAEASYVDGKLHIAFGLPEGKNGPGTGDMLRADYDKNDSGVVDDAERLGGQLPGYYAPASTVSTQAQIIAFVRDALYPVGSIYLSVSATSPATLMGGTWARIAQGRTLVGLNESDTDFNTVRKAAGDKTVTLTTAQMPVHRHAFEYSTDDSATWTVNAQIGRASSQYQGAGFMGVTDTINALATFTARLTTTGSGAAHSNLQPYYTVYIWERTA